MLGAPRFTLYNDPVQDAPRPTLYKLHATLKTSFTLCFDHGARRLWIRPTPTDPTTRFVEVKEFKTLPEGEYHACVTLSSANNRVRVRDVVDGDRDLGGMF